MADLKEPLNPEAPVSSWDDVPEQKSARLPLLPKGPYEFQLPHNLSPKHWEEAELKEKVNKDGKTIPASKYRRVSFDADLPLVVVRSVDEALVNTLFEGSISTMPRPRFGKKKGDPVKQVSDAVYLYRDALKGSTVGFTPDNHQALVEAICKAGAGKTFLANVVWPAYCNKQKVRRVVDSAGQTVEDPEGKVGCGENFRDAPAENFTCKCGAAIRVFPELAQFRAVESE